MNTTTTIPSPTPTWQTFEALVCSLSHADGALTLDQEAAVMLIRWAIRDDLKALHALATERRDGALILALKKLQRKIGLLAMVLPVEDGDEGLKRAREWKDGGVEVH